MAPRATERLAAARAEVERVCQLLEDPTPTQLDRCSGMLAVAVAEVAACRESENPAGRGQEHARKAALEEARSLERSVGRARRLLEAAAAFHTNWIQCLSALCAGYTDRGEPATLERGSRICARG